MRTTSKSPLRILITAHEIGGRSLRQYAHRFRPRKFTQPQLFACLILKAFLRLDDRKLAASLRDIPDPHFHASLAQLLTTKDAKSPARPLAATTNRRYLPRGGRAVFKSPLAFGLSEYLRVEPLRGKDRHRTCIESQITFFNPRGFTLS